MRRKTTDLLKCVTYLKHVTVTTIKLASMYTITNFKFQYELYKCTFLCQSYVILAAEREISTQW